MSGKKFRLSNGTYLDYETVFMQSYNSLVLYAERYVGSREESMSVIHDVFLSLWGCDCEFENRTALQKYIYVSARNKALNNLRNKNLTTDYDDRRGAYRDRFFFIEEETFRLLLGEVAKLPPHQHAVVLLALDDKTNDEIASLLNISVNTVKFHKKNAYRTLRGKMADDYLLSILLF
jgi:RNA polymerase sigma-70 factor (ECF subfamily)